MTKLIQNGNITVEVQATVSATLEMIKQAGGTIGKTSLSDLLAGRKSEACGFIVTEAAVKAPVEEVKPKAAKQIKEAVEGEEKAETKAEHARRVFNKHFGKMKPKEIKALFVSEVGLSERGANTYYYNIKSEVEGK